MPAPRTAHTSLDVGSEANTMLAGLSMLTMIYFPFALPFLILLVGPLLVLALPLALLGGILALPVVLIRATVRGVRRRRAARAARGPRVTTAEGSAAAASHPRRRLSGSPRPG